MNTIYNFKVDLDWDLSSLINRIEHFRGSWNFVERHEAQSLKLLRSIATTRSVGASTRIEGSKLSDEDVDQILSALSFEKLTERDAQEVAGYYDSLELILHSFQDIAITENNIKDLHNRMLKYSTKDEWHNGEYKKHVNHVQANMPDGTSRIIFQTTPPGYPTSGAMRSLFEWYQEDQKTHPLVRIAVFVYELLSIHPFQDGNGRMSRLITSLLLLKEGFGWIQFISFEHEIENRKTEYYATLRASQSQRPNEDVTPWIRFFLDCLVNLQQLLESKLQTSGIESQLSTREKSILLLVREKPGIQSGHLATQLTIPNPTVKRILSKLVDVKLILKIGVGRGTGYKGN